MSFITYIHENADTLEYRYLSTYAVYGSPVVDIEVVAVNGKELDDSEIITIPLELIFNGFTIGEAIENELAEENFGEYHLPYLTE